jgi:hypothetical protein
MNIYREKTQYCKTEVVAQWSSKWGIPSSNPSPAFIFTEFLSESTGSIVTTDQPLVAAHVATAVLYKMNQKRIWKGHVAYPIVSDRINDQIRWRVLYKMNQKRIWNGHVAYPIVSDRINDQIRWRVSYDPHCIRRISDTCAAMCMKYRSNIDNIRCEVVPFFDKIEIK